MLIASFIILPCWQIEAAKRKVRVRESRLERFPAIIYWEEL
jgi:hypothetical protein